MNEPVHHAIFREPTPEEAELMRRREELAARRAALAARERELSDLRGHLFSFEGRYIRQVGLLYKQLDEWEERIAELSARSTPLNSLDFERAAAEELAASAERPAVPLLPDLKALFRELAKRIHPDFATNDDDERKRTRLMAQANDALRREDHRALQRMLNGFEAPAEMTGAQAIEAETANVLFHIELVEQDILAAEAEIEALEKSEIASLEKRAIEAAMEGRDLLAEMAARVKGRIGITMRQYELDLDRIKRPPAGFAVESLLSAESSPAPASGTKRRVWPQSIRSR